MKSRKLLWLGMLVAATVVALIVQPVTVFAQEFLELDIVTNNLMWQRTQNIFFMYMLVAFLMLFVKRMEWIVCLATMLTLCISLPVYAALKMAFAGSFVNMAFALPWTIEFLAMGIVMSITLVIAIGVCLGQVKHGAYVIMGITFPFAFLAMEWFMFEYLVGVLDAGGSIVVHAAAWAFGFGMIMTIRSKSAMTAPMDTTTHSVSFVWLASMLLFILWPSFVTVLLTPGQIVDVAIVTYMSGFGAAVAAYAVNWVIDKKVDPLIYTYAMLCGMVAIGSTCDIVNPWQGLIIGIAAGAISVLCFKYWQPFTEKAFGVKDMMGVQNLHGVGGIFGALICAVMFAGLVQVWALLGAIVIMWVVGGITGLLVRSRPALDVDDSEVFAVEPGRAEPY